MAAAKAAVVTGGANTQLVLSDLRWTQDAVPATFNRVGTSAYLCVVEVSKRSRWRGRCDVTEEATCVCGPSGAANLRLFGRRTTISVRTSSATTSTRGRGGAAT